MKNSKYWARRFSQLEDAQNKIGASSLSDIEKQYRQAQKTIEGQITSWYQRFADNNEITLAEARQYLNAADLKEFKWDVNDYIKYGQENAVSGSWMKQLENASAKYHVSKLEALKVQTQNSLETMFAKQGATLTSTLQDVYTSGYYHTAYELQNGFGVGFDISGIDQSQIEKILSKPWAVDGYNFSERIWNNKDKLISTVHNELTQNIMLGKDPQKAIDAIAKKMNTSKTNAGRLVMTEEAYFSSLSQKDCFNELGVEEYEIVATLDSHTSEICQSMDGQHFPMKDYQAGVTAPPFHVWCRSTTAPYFDEEFDIGERAARDENGDTYYVPDDMDYKKWKETFVDGGDKSGFTVIDDGSALHYNYKVDETATATPKKEYLTENKLKSKIADADVQIDDLKGQADKILTDFGVDYDYMMTDGGGIDTFYSEAVEGDKYYTSSDEMQKLEDKYGGWDELMDNGSDEDILKYDQLSDAQIKAEAALNQKGFKTDGFGNIVDMPKEEVKAALQEKAQLEALQQQINDLETQKAEWQEKLNQKLIAKEKKALTKQQMELETQKTALQQQLDDFEVKTYSGIWKDDVTTADYSHLNIQGKKDYYENQIFSGKAGDKVAQFQEYLDELDELETEGKSYAEIQSELNKVESEMKKIQADLTKLENGDIIDAVDDIYTQERKDAALWFDRAGGGFREADKYFDPAAKALLSDAKKNARNQFDGFYTYTSGSGGHNRPLAGFQKPWSEYGTGWEERFYKGAKNVWIDYEGKGAQIRGLTDLISRSTYDQDVWLQSGQDFATLEGFLGIPKGTLSRMTEAELQQFVGREETFYQFISTAVNEGGGGCFNSKPMKLNIYAPKGSQMLYASDAGAFGKGENEMILQRGGKYKITKIYWGNDATDGNTRKIFVDMELHSDEGYDLFQQDPSEWTGSKKNYRN